MTQLWHNLSVSKKLYVVVGIMASLIATELFTLYFAMNTLSAVRALVGGEGLWSKAQKNAVYSLEKYSVTHDEQYYLRFKEQLNVPLGDHKVRLELAKANPDMQVITVGFLEGQNNIGDVEPMVNLLRRFHSESHLSKAVDMWREADEMVSKLVAKAEELRTRIQRQDSPEAIDKTMDEVSALDEQLTEVEIRFSSSLGEASRWLEHLLKIILLLAVVTIEGTGLTLTISFARGLTKILRELNSAATMVGEGDFSQKVPIRSGDELGQLAASINLMTENLQKQIIERESAEQASEAKNLFLANISHEMRTPLNAILGFAELLANSDLTEGQRTEYLNVVKRTGATLTSIINDILDIAKIEAQQVQVTMTSFQLPQLISDIKSLLNVRCFEKGIQLYIIPKGDIADVIQSDPARLRQILINLIGNAIKFTHQGSVTVTYEVISPYLTFTVKDTGGGISEAQRSRLFKPFSQGDDSVRKKYGGTGLGLMISQRLARLLGGDVELSNSQLGKGSTFVARVTYNPIYDGLPQISSSLEIDLEKFRDKKILVVEDTVDNQTLVRLFLAKTNAQIDFVDNGREGVEAIRKTAYDIVLMDMQMPVMDGFTATKEIRKNGFTSPIIAMTGYAMKKDQDRCFEVGCTDYIAKPFDRVTLLTSLMKYL